MTVRTLLRSISSRELSEWAAYERLTGPLGGARADLHAGIVASTVYNANRGKGRAAKPGDFIPTWDRRKRSPEELWRLAMAANAAVGGTVRAPSTTE